MNADALREEIRRSRARVDLEYFTRRMFAARRGYEWQRAEHHGIIAKALQRVFSGECKRLIVNVPPRYSKTELAVVNFAAWALGRYPDAEFIHTSYSAQLATQNAWQVRELVRHDEYRRIFPGVNIRQDSTAKHEWRTTAGGVFYAVGAGGTITGYGAGKAREGFGGAIIVDDPHKADEAHSATQRRAAVEWFSNTLESRKNSPDTPIILIMQRLHPEDLSGWLLGGGNGEHWEHVCLPALRDDGTPLWAAKHTTEDLRRLEKANRQVFAGQYQQRPVADGGNLIRGEWLQSYDIAPPMRYRMMYVDTAQKTGQHNDFTVAQEWGMGTDGKLYLLDQLRGRFEVPELERRLPAFWAKAKARDAAQWGALRQMKVEDAASGTGFIQRMKMQAAIPVAGITRKRDKYSRLCDIMGYLEAGYVAIPRAAPYTADFLAECEAFSADMSHAHDDQVDPMIDAVTEMLAGNNAADIWSNMI